MKERNIFTYRLRSEDERLVQTTIEKFEGLIFKSILDLKEASERLNECDGICLFIDEQMDAKVFENILKQFSKTPVAVILKYKDFDLLMLCLKYKVLYVFEGRLDQKNLESFLIQVDLKGKKNQTELPVAAIMELFSIPAKTKTNDELLNRLKTYFSYFENVKNINVISTGDEAVSQNLRDKLRNIKLPDQYIGFQSTLSEQGEFITVATPVLNFEDESSWVVLDLPRHNKDFILNELLFKFLENVLIYRINKLKEQNLEVLATTDEITGLYNQRKLSQDLEDAVIKHEKEDETFSIMFIDVDHFKSVNDNYGHVVGSKLLQDIGEVLSLILRASDHIYRYGGDEFVVIMPTVDIKTVHDIASRVLVKIKNKSFQIDNGETYKLSVSIGIAEYPTDAKSALEIIRFADEMMYMSKRSGRGKVFHVKEVENVDASAE